MSKIKVKMGDVFLIPLRSSGYGIGLVARKSRSILLGYFWGKNFSEIPNQFEFSNLKKGEAIWIKQFGIRGLENGDWIILGNMPGFDKKEWEIPKFLRKVDPFGKFIISYDDKLNPINQRKVPDDFAEQYPDDGVAGYGFVEIKLTDFLKEV